VCKAKSLGGEKKSRNEGGGDLVKKQVVRGIENENYASSPVRDGASKGAANTSSGGNGRYTKSHLWKDKKNGKSRYQDNQGRMGHKEGEKEKISMRSARCSRKRSLMRPLLRTRPLLP